MNFRRGLKRLLIVGFGLWCVIGLYRGSQKISAAGRGASFTFDTDCYNEGHSREYCRFLLESINEGAKLNQEIARRVRWSDFGVWAASYPSWSAWGGSATGSFAGS